MSKKFTTGEEEDNYRYPLNEDLHAGLKTAVRTNRMSLAMEYAWRLIAQLANRVDELEETIASLSKPAPAAKAPTKAATAKAAAADKESEDGSE